MDLSCLRKGFEQGVVELGLAEPDALGALFVIGFILAVAMAPIVLWLYQRRVEKLMSSRGEASSPASSAVESGPSIPGSEAESEAWPDSPEALLAAVREGSRAQHRMLLVSIGVFAVLVGGVLTLSTMIAEGTDFRSPVHWLDSAVFAFALAVGLSAPLVLVGVKNRRLRTAFWIFCALLLAAAAVWDIGYDEALSTAEKSQDLGYAALWIGILVVVAAGRRLRNVVPLLTLLNFVSFLVLLALGLLAETFSACDTALASSIFLGLAVLLPWGAYRVTRALMEWVCAAYERQAFSETQLLLILWITNAALMCALQAGPDSGGAAAPVDLWTVAVLFALLVSVAVYLGYARRLTPWPSPRPVLLLRVFSKSRRTQRLLDDLSYRWSFLGPIYLVGGPDLASAYLEPHELLSFLRRRARELFVLDREDLRRRLDRLETSPDPDSRHRIHEFFCLADVWQEAVEALLDVAPFVLLDLRGFDAAREGTAFELTLLARKEALGRTTFLMDESTDPAAVARALADVPGAEMPADRILRVEPSTGSTEVLRALLSG